MINMGHEGATGGHNIQIQIGEENKRPESEGPAQPVTFWLIASGVVAVLLIGFVSALIRDDGKEGVFPKRGDRWPPGATVPVVLAPVVGKLQACAGERIPKPENGPQIVTDTGSERATWALDGNPADGARIKYHDGRFEVIGHAVMTVTYSGYTGQKLSVQRVVYRTRVSWNSGHPVLDGQLHATEAKPDAPIVKRVTSQTWGQVQASLRATFKICEETTQAPMPLFCPRDVATSVPADHVHWRFDSDPLLNTRTTFDNAWGLIKVTGNYAVTLRSGGWLTPREQRSGGAYEATLAVRGNGWPQVLKIERK